MPFAAAQGSLWTRPAGQVGWPFEIDWSSREADGLEACVVAAPMGMIDLVSGQIGIRSGSEDPGHQNDAGGVGAWFDGVSDYYSFADNAPIDTSLPFALVWEGQINGYIDSDSTILACVSALGGGLRMIVRASSGRLFLTDNGTTLRTITPPSGVSFLDYVWGVWSYSPALGHEAWINGLPAGTGAAHTASASSNLFRVGADSGSTARDYYGTIRQIRLYRRSWTLDDAIAFSAPSMRDGLFVGSAIRPVGMYGGRLYGNASGAGEATGGAVPQVDVSLMADGFAIAGGSAHLSSAIPPTMTEDSRYTVRAPLRDYRVAMPQRNRAA